MPPAVRPRPLAGFVAVAIAAVGCSRSPSGPDVDALKAVAELYAQYAAANRGAVPTDEKQFRKFLADLDTRATRAEAGPAAPPAGGPKPTRFDKYFTSARDGQPFVVRYGTPVSYAKDSTAILAHERDGADGQALVVYANGRVDKVPLATIQRP